MTAPGGSVKNFDDFFERYTTPWKGEEFDRSITKVLYVALVYDIQLDIYVGELTIGFTDVVGGTTHRATGISLESVVEQLDRVMEKRVANQYIKPIKNSNEKSI